MAGHGLPVNRFWVSGWNRATEDRITDHSEPATGWVEPKKEAAEAASFDSVKLRQLLLGAAVPVPVRSSSRSIAAARVP